MSGSSYYVPHETKWPFLATIALMIMFIGLANYMNDESTLTLTLTGLGLLLIVIYGWFSYVVRESEGGLYDDQVDMSFRWGMAWFIFSEVMFFAAFFGALFYARMFSIPWLGGEGHGGHNGTHQFLWESFQASWPMNVMPDPSKFTQYKEVIPAWGVPALNTAILLASGITVTLAHWALKAANRQKLALWLFFTVALGFIFVYFQAEEYAHAMYDLNLTLNSGIYGSTFYMLTGFHGFHVTMGAVMLLIILLRCLKGHFSKKDHFAFEAVAWYWHFVDVVWLGLFIFVYWV